MSKNTGNTAKTTRVVATPGTDPALTQTGAEENTSATGEGSQAAATDAFTATSSVAGGDAQGAGQADPGGDTASLQQQVADLTALVKQLAAQRAPSNMPSVAKLPTMAEVLKNKPEVPVLTEEGWLVPATTLATRA